MKHFSCGLFFLYTLLALNLTFIKANKTCSFFNNEGAYFKLLKLLYFFP